MTKLICGYGFVGRAMHKMFPDVYVFDRNGDAQSKAWENGAPQISHHDFPKFDVCFVCTPTPMKEDGSCDISSVEESMRWNSDLFVIRSTISPGTTDMLNQIKPCVFHPEYIGETTAHPLLDEAQTPFVILGGPEALTDRAISIYQEVYNASVRFYQVSGLEAEIIKAMENASIGTMVTFCNTFYEICKTFGVSYNKIREGFLADPRMSRFFTLVYEKQRGFDGKCLPKDINAIYKASNKKGYSAPLLRSILDINKGFNELSL